MKKAMILLFVLLCLTPALKPRGVFGQESVQQTEPKPVLVTVESEQVQQAETLTCGPGMGSLRPQGPITQAEAVAQNHTPNHHLFAPLLSLGAEACKPIGVYDEAVAKRTANGDIVFPSIDNGTPTFLIGEAHHEIFPYELSTDTTHLQPLADFIIRNQAVPQTTTGYKQLIGVWKVEPSPSVMPGIAQGQPLSPEDFLRSSGEFQWQQRMRHLKVLSDITHIPLILRPNTRITAAPYTATFTTPSAVCPAIASYLQLEAEVIGVQPFFSLGSGSPATLWVAVGFSDHVRSQCPILDHTKGYIWYIGDLAAWAAMDREVQRQIDASVVRAEVRKSEILIQQPSGGFITADTAYSVSVVGAALMMIVVALSSAMAAPAMYIMAYMEDDTWQTEPNSAAIPNQ